MPSLTFPAADSPDFKEAMARNQELAARVMYTVDEALVPINAALEYRDREPSRRWRAHYDLVRGRLLAVKIRCFEYNCDLRKMKKDMPRFTKEKSNAWRLVPSGDVQSNPKAAEAAHEARSFWNGHRGTPRHPLGPARPARAQRPVRTRLARNLRPTPPAPPRARRRRQEKSPKPPRKETPAAAETLNPNGRMRLGATRHSFSQ